MRLPGFAPESNRDRIMKNLGHQHKRIYIYKILQEHNSLLCHGCSNMIALYTKTEQSEISDSISQPKVNCKRFFVGNGNS